MKKHIERILSIILVLGLVIVQICSNEVFAKSEADSSSVDTEETLVMEDDEQNLEEDEEDGSDYVAEDEEEGDADEDDEELDEEIQSIDDMIDVSFTITSQWAEHYMQM